MRDTIVQKYLGSDPLTRPLLGSPWLDGCLIVDGWTIVHFGFYALLSFLGFGWLQLFLLGVAWESLEFVFARKREPHVVTDFAANILGFFAGLLLRRAFNLASTAMPLAPLVTALKYMGGAYLSFIGGIGL